MNMHKRIRLTPLAREEIWRLYQTRLYKISHLAELYRVSYSDNGKEYKDNASHAFVQACQQHNIEQKFTRVARPQTNDKAERVIRTIMQMWHEKMEFKDTAHRHIELNHFINFYNTVKPHKSLNMQTPYEILNHYFNQPNCKQRD